ncbi:MAG: 2-dehydropantoate 2-reductase N-terminal domain-containing protein [Byssovorax sp.]
MRRYLVLGAGAVGAAIGGLLQRSGREVMLIARGAHLAALQRDRLTLVSPAGASTLAVRAVASAREIDFTPGDVLVLAVKSQGSAAALADLAAVAPRDLPVICAQNGVSNEPLAARSFSRVYGMVVFSPLALLVPGKVAIHTAPFAGGLDLGCFPRGTDALVDEVVADLSNAGFAARAEPKIQRLKYGKLLSNLGNALQALGGAAAMQSPLLGAVNAEGRACLIAADIEFAEVAEVYERNAAIVDLPVEGSTRQGGSSWQSLARGTGQIEADFLNGEIVRLGELHGFPTPLNRRLTELALQAAEERWPPGKLSVAEIEARLA